MNDKKPEEETLERILISREIFSKVESEIRFHEHLRRYAAIRRFCYGNVIDFASGCGYGSFLLSANPDVEKVVGIDNSEHAIAWAKKEFLTEKTEFRCVDIEKVQEKFDTLVSLEAIEHFEDTSLLPRLAERCDVDTIIISYPNKKSTNFNKYHLHDFSVQDIVDLMDKYLCYHRFMLGDVQFLLFAKKPPKAPSHIFNYLHDLIH